LEGEEEEEVEEVGEDLLRLLPTREPSKSSKVQRSHLTNH